MEQYILIGASSFGERDRTPLDRIAAAGLGVIENPFRRKLTRAELLDLLKPNVVGLLAGLEPLDADVLRLSSLKVVSRIGSGMANVDVDAARELGIAVHFTPSGPTEAVAELTLGALLALMRMIPEMNADLHAGRWSKRIGSQLEGRTVAIVGYGRIGRRVAELVRPFRVRIIIVDPLLTPAAAVPDALMTLEDALPLADVVTLHCSGEQLLVGQAELARMKPGAILLNAARGGLVDETALARALQEKRLGGAWLDTFANEPYTGPLTECRNAILTPHVGSYTEECRLQMETEAVDNLLLGLAESRR
jgi:D-3-phosphoglycerate dehydrogenase / 2-oxoglutarate reductase